MFVTNIESVQYLLKIEGLCLTEVLLRLYGSFTGRHKFWSDTSNQAKEHRGLTPCMFLCCDWKTGTFAFEYLKQKQNYQTNWNQVLKVVSE